MKKVYYVFVIIFILLLMAPAIAMPFTYSDVSTENRNLASFPLLTDKEGRINGDFTSQLEAFITDHIGFRNQMVKANTALYTGVFGVSPEPSVILGTDGWLYYANTLNDCMNVPTLSERNVTNIAKTYKMVQDYLDEQGISFAMTVAPNKSTIYPEHMPAYYVVGNGDGNLELLEKAFAGEGVNYADIENAVSDADEVLYQTYDSHWNYKGALLGYNTILDAVNYEHNRFENLTFDSVKDWKGDLAGMLYADGAEADYQLYPNITFAYETTSHETAVDALNLTFHNDKGNGNVTLYRDSFGNAMQVYFGENFEDAYLTRSYPYDITQITAHNSEIGVIEIVERNIINLARKAPVMPAPVCDSSVIEDAKMLDGKEYVIRAEDKGNYFHIYGWVNPYRVEDDYEVYFLMGDNTVYKAFPIYEQELLEDDELGDTGFSIYFPKDSSDMDGTMYLYVRNPEGK